MKGYNTELEMDGAAVHCNGDKIGSPLILHVEQDTFKLHIKTESPGCTITDLEENMSIVGRKRKRQHSSSEGNNISETAKRVKEEHLYIKPEADASQPSTVKTLNSDSVINGNQLKTEQNKEVNAGKSKQDNSIYLNASTSSLSKQSSIRSFFSPIKKTEEVQRLNTSSNNTQENIARKLYTPNSDIFICCNCEYYRILTKSDLRNHSKFHKNVEPLSHFNRFRIALSRPRIVNMTPEKAKDATKIQNNQTLCSPKKAPSKICKKSSPTKKWNDKSPAAKVLKTLTKEPQQLLNCMYDLIRKMNLTKKKVIPEMVTAFLLFVRERHLIWARRHNNMPRKDWTQNKILKEHWFTNIYRELDRGTAFFKRNLHETVFRSRTLEPLIGSNHLKTLKRILLKCFSYRLINRLNTFVEFGKLPDIGDYQDWVTFLRYKYQLTGGESIIFTRAHQNNGLERYFKSMEFVVSRLTSMAKDLQEAAEERSVNKCFLIIKSVPGVGKFMAWQILCDLLEVRQLGECTDNQWTCLGPGARNGLQKIFKEVKDELLLTRQLRDLCQASGESSAYQALNLDPPLLLGKEVSLKNIEHALCEFDKYVRFAMGEGVRQRRFNHTTSSAHYDKLTQRCPECYKDVRLQFTTPMPKSLKVKECPLCKRLYHDGCTSKQQKQMLERVLGKDECVWICPSCLPMVDCWQREDNSYDEPPNCVKTKYFSKKSPKTKRSSSNYPGKGIDNSETVTQKHIETIILSDSDDEANDALDPRSVNKKGKSNKRDKIGNNSIPISSTYNDEMSDHSDEEQEKENTANEINGDIDEELDEEFEYLCEKERKLKEQIRALPLF